MQRLPTATAAGAGVASLLVALLLVSVLPGASGGDAGPPLGGRKMGFAGETAGVPARYFDKVALLEIQINSFGLCFCTNLLGLYFTIDSNKLIRFVHLYLYTELCLDEEKMIYLYHNILKVLYIRTGKVRYTSRSC